MSARKYESGAQKRKKTAIEKAEVKKHPKITKFLVSSLPSSTDADKSVNPSTSTLSDSSARNSPTCKAESGTHDFSLDRTLELDANVEDVGIRLSEVSVILATKNQPVVPSGEETGPLATQENSERTDKADTDTDTISIPHMDVVSDDPGEWKRPFSQKTIDLLVSKGPKQVRLQSYPTDDNGRHFANFHFSRVLENKERVVRRWLLYSVSKNRIFCFCCMLLGTPDQLLTHEGFNQWGNTSKRLSAHELSPRHMSSENAWAELEQRLRTCRTVDASAQHMVQTECQRWRNVLTRLLNVTMYLARNNMAFRGSSDKLYTPNNGKFLGLVELLAVFDPVMSEHLRLASKKDRAVHYCGKRIQDEMIILLANKTKSAIIEKAKNAKYFSIIADCTPDISHKEQLSLTIRIVVVTEKGSKIEEHFLGFLVASESTGKYLSDTILNFLKSESLDIANCRGQGYDNGSNMKGKHSGVQKRILDVSPLAFYLPCGSHSLNLIICDGVGTSIPSQSLFGTVRRLYSLFSASISRWEIMKTNISSFTLKRSCDTRWEAKIDALKPLRYDLVGVYNSLVELSNVTKSTDPEVSNEASCLALQLCDFSFLVSLVTWYDVLFQVNIISKVMQSPELDISQAHRLLQNAYAFFRTCRDSGFSESVLKAREIAESVGVEPVFRKIKRLRKIKKFFDEKSHDEPIEDPEKKFEVTFFNPLIELVTEELNSRFTQLDIFYKNWGFLFDLKTVNNDTLISQCKDLENLLTVKERSETKDLNGLELFNEISSLRKFALADKPALHPKLVLDFIITNQLVDAYPNVFVALRILLTAPVTVASGERSFSKLKLIKTFLRSTMGQERLSSLGMLSIENGVTKELNLQKIIDDFADLKARKVPIK